MQPDTRRKYVTAGIEHLDDLRRDPNTTAWDVALSDKTVKPNIYKYAEEKRKEGKPQEESLFWRRLDSCETSEIAKRRRRDRSLISSRLKEWEELEEKKRKRRQRFGLTSLHDDTQGNMTRMMRRAARFGITHNSGVSQRQTTQAHQSDDVHNMASHFHKQVSISHSTADEKSCASKNAQNVKLQPWEEEGENRETKELQVDRMGKKNENRQSGGEREIDVAEHQAKLAMRRARCAQDWERGAQTWEIAEHLLENKRLSHSRGKREKIASSGTGSDQGSLQITDESKIAQRWEEEGEDWGTMEFEREFKAVKERTASEKKSAPSEGERSRGQISRSVRFQSAAGPLRMTQKWEEDGESW